MSSLRRELARCRKQGYAVNTGQTERGVCAVGVLVTDVDGPVGGLSVSVPSVRYQATLVPELVDSLNRAATSVVAQLRA
ncbi:MAG: IclR family transcriptional regulator C-terminal domain-containing protein [Dermatophilaceae bacterium]